MDIIQALASTAASMYLTSVRRKKGGQRRPESSQIIEAQVAEQAGVASSRPRLPPDQQAFRRWKLFIFLATLEAVKESSQPDICLGAFPELFYLL